jgi:hypothetical protein
MRLRGAEVLGNGQNSAPQLPKVPENRIIHGNDIVKTVIKASK